jgi:hypothetical protein
LAQDIAGDVVDSEPLEEAEWEVDRPSAGKVIGGGVVEVLKEETGKR